MTDSDDAGIRAEAERIHQTILEVFRGRGFDQAELKDRTPSLQDIQSLLLIEPAPKKVLQAGGGAGVSTMMLALAYPHARIVRVAPDLPVSSTDRRSSLDVAREAAQAAGVDRRIEFVSGGFSEKLTRRSVIDADLRSDRVQVRVVGPETCAREQPFDLAYIDGLTSADARASDIRLAASALTDAGVIVSANSVGTSGATVRAGVFEFLRYYPDYTFSHERLDDPDRSLGFLQKRSPSGTGDRSPAEARETQETPMDVRDRLADLVALAVGRRPILEVAVAAPVLGAAFRVRGLASRTLRLTKADWNTHFFDPVIDQICNALDHSPDSTLFSADLMDYAPDEFVGRLFARLEDRRSHALFFATPPGEVGVAGPRSRPVARIVDLAASQNVKALAPAALEFERTRHEGAGRPGWLGGSSRYASFVMFARNDAGRDARGRNIPEVSPQSLSVREQVELQRIWSEAALQRSLTETSLRRASAESERDDALTRWREATQAVATERASAERSMVSLRSELQRVRADLAELNQKKLEAETAAENAESRLRAVEAGREEAEGALRGEIGQLRSDLSSAQGERDEIAQALEALRLSASEMEEAQQARIAELEVALQSFKTEREALILEKNEAEAAKRQAEAEREEVELDLGARLRNADAALAELQGAASASNAAELDELKARYEDLLASRGSSDEEIEELRTRYEAELEDLRIQLSAESLQVVDAACRDTDTRARLDGVANHLALTQDALRRFREDPDGFLAGDVPYPCHPVDLSDHDENVVVRAAELHGRAADLSREVAIELERLARDRADYLSWKARQVEISETSHAEALRIAHSEFSDRFWAQERLNGRIASGLAFNNRLLADILALTRGEVEDPALLNAELEALELATSTDISFDALDQVTAQEKRLLHLLHTLEAEDAFEGVEIEDEPGDLPDIELVEGDVLDPEPQEEPEPEPESDRIIRPPGFQSDVSGGVERGSESAARDLRLNPVRVVEFPSRDRKAREEEWSFGESPTWFVQRRETRKRPGGMIWNRLWERVRTYPETARLVRLQRSLRDELVTCPVSPRVFDVDLYRAQGTTAPYAEPLHHYLLEGEAAGWSPLSGFDPAYYATQVGDLGSWKGSLLRHFLSRGIHDRRSPSRKLEGLSDRAAAEGMEPLEYFYHWENAARGTWRDDPDQYD